MLDHEKVKTASGLKVLYLPSWYPSTENPNGGIFNQVQAAALSEYHEVLVVPPPSGVSLLTRSPQWVDRCEVVQTPYGFRELLLSGPNYTPGWPGSYERIAWRLYCKSFRHATEIFGSPPDLIHAHSVEAGYVGVKLAEKYGCRVVLTEHINHPSWLLSTPSAAERFHYTMERAHGVICVSPGQRELLYQAGVKRHLEVVPNLIDTDFFDVAPSFDPAPPFRLLVVGALIPRKGHQFLLDAIAEVHKKGYQLHLDVVGTGAVHDQLQNQANLLGIPSQVQFHGGQPQQKIRDFLRRAHIYVCPSITESFAVAVIEALSVGRPVVVTRSGGPESYVSQLVGELVEPRSTDSLVEGILKVIKRFHEFKPEELHEFVEKRFSKAVVVKAITEEYKRALRIPRLASFRSASKGMTVPTVEVD